MSTDPIDRAVHAARKVKREFDTEDLPLAPQTWHVLVEPYEPEEYSDGGIALSEGVQNANNILSSIAKIMALGPDVHHGKSISGIDLASMNLEVGQFVYVQPYTGVELYFKGGFPKLKLIANTNILGVLLWEPKLFRIYAG